MKKNYVIVLKFKEFEEPIKYYNQNLQALISNFNFSLKNYFFDKCLYEMTIFGLNDEILLKINYLNFAIN